MPKEFFNIPLNSSLGVSLKIMDSSGYVLNSFLDLNTMPLMLEMSTLVFDKDNRKIKFGDKEPEIDDINIVEDAQYNAKLFIEKYSELPDLFFEECSEMIIPYLWIYNQNAINEYPTNKTRQLKMIKALYEEHTLADIVKMFIENYFSNNNIYIPKSIYTKVFFLEIANNWQWRLEKKIDLNCLEYQKNKQIIKKQLESATITSPYLSHFLLCVFLGESSNYNQQTRSFAQKWFDENKNNPEIIKIYNHVQQNTKYDLTGNDIFKSSYRLAAKLANFWIIQYLDQKYNN